MYSFQRQCGSVVGGFQGCKKLFRNNNDNYYIRHYSKVQKDTILKLKGRSLLCIDDYSKEELQAILAFSKHIKELVKSKKIPRVMEGESVASLFQKRSTRTRVSTDTGMSLLGGTSLFLSSDDIQLGVNESIKDSSLVLSRFNSLILARVFGHNIVEELDRHAQVPVINALSDMYHPLQTLADFLTIQEKFGTENVKGKNLAWIGDGNNVLHDLMLAAPALGVNLRICVPANHQPNADVLKRTQNLADKYNTELLVTDKPKIAVENSNIVVTDTWVSMGQEEEAALRLKEFKGYEINSKLMKLADENAIFMHCLPRHKEEVTDEVFYSNQSVVFDEAENRMYTVMAVMCSMLGKADF